MGENRVAGTALGIVLILALWFIFFLSFLSGDIHAAFYWGLPIGTILGIVTCFRLAKTWDPIYLRPTNPNTKKAGEWVFWTVPIGIILARILPRLVGEELTALFMGCLLVWVSFTLGYAVIQAWRYRPR